MTFVILMAAAVFSVILGAALILYGKKLYGACTSQAKGIVVDIYHSDLSQDDGYAPVIEFNAGGEAVRARARTEKTGGRFRVPFEVGDQVELRYDPKNPKHFLVEGYDQNIIVYVGASGFLAAVILVVTAILFFR